MAQSLKRAKFSQLMKGSNVIVQDGIDMIPGVVEETGTGSNKMFCTVNVEAGLKEYYFENIWVIMERSHSGRVHLS
jgi:hypothetical protein